MYFTPLLDTFKHLKIPIKTTTVFCLITDLTFILFSKIILINSNLKYFAYNEAFIFFRLKLELTLFE